MFRNISLLTLLFCATTGFAQNNSLSKITQLYYNQQNWDAIIKIEDSINLQPSQNDVLWSHLGGAFFKKGNYNKAEKYLQKAYNLNPQNELALELLFYTDQYQGNVLDANQLRNKMTEPMKALVSKDFPLKTLKNIIVEGGVNILQETEVGKNKYYGSLLTLWNISNAIQLNFGANYLTQEIDGGKYTQPELYLSVPFSLGKNWNIIPAVHGLSVKYDTNIITTNITTSSNVLSVIPPRREDITLTTDTNFSSNETSKLFFTQLNISKRWGNFKIQPSAGIHFQNIDGSQTSGSVQHSNRKIYNTNTNTLIQEINNPDTIFPSTTSNYSQNNTISQFGLSLFYTAKLGKLYWVLNPNFFVVNTSEDIDKKDGTALSFYNNFYLEKWRFALSYLMKDNLPFADKEGLFYFNFSDKITSRISGSIGYEWTKKFETILTYQNETQQRQSNSQNIHYNSFYLTLNFKF